MRPVHCLALLLLSAGCGGAADDGWVREVRESGIDGRVLSAARDFHPQDGTAFLRVTAECKTRTQDLVLRLESYEKAAKGETYPPSPFVLDDGDETLDGRVAFTSLAGQPGQTATLGEFFALKDYNNVAEWDPAAASAGAWLVVDDAAFWPWAATVAPNPAQLDPQALEQGMRMVVGGMTGLAGLAQMAGGASADQAMQQVALKVGGEFAAHARAAGKVAQLSGGQLVRRMLPITLDVANGGGRHEITMPADAPALLEVLQACAGGTPWWTTMTPRSAAPAAAPAAIDSAAPAAADSALPEDAGDGQFDPNDTTPRTERIETR